jgi:RNA-directed DNA polymerase
VWAHGRLADRAKERARRGHRFARYGEDFLSVVKSQRAGERGKARGTRLLRQQLKLESKESKRTGGPTKDGRFVGFPVHGSRRSWSPEAVQDSRHRRRKRTGRSWGVSMADRSRQLNEYLRGGRQSFGRSQYDRPRPELDAWLRRRRRRGLWKPGRSGKTTGRELLKLGTAKPTALLTARSRKGPWQRSRPLATQTGRTNPWLSDTLGLVSIRALWIALHSPACTAECGPAGSVVWGLGRATSLATRLGEQPTRLRI